MNSIKEATQEDFDLLTQSMALICDNDKNLRYSIVLDCLEFTQSEFISKFWKLSFTQTLAISNKTLDKFILVTQSKLLKTLSTPIIFLKKAQHYTFIVNNLDQALKMV